jgi:hypothetical protein
MSTFSVQQSQTPQQPAPGQKSARDEATTVDTSVTADTPKDPKPTRNPRITKFGMFSVPHLAKKPDPRDARKPAEPKFPRARDLVPSFTNPFGKPKPAAGTDGTPADGSPDAPASTSDSTTSGGTK